LEQDGSTLHMRHGKFTRAAFQMIDLEGYDDWTPFSPDDMSQTDSLAGVVAAVRWACAKGTEVPIIGVHFDGEYALATDRYRFAVTPYKLDIPKPITVPHEAITSVLKAADSTLIRTDGSHLYMMPDEFTQISTSLYGVDYPPIRRVMRRDFPAKVKVSKKELMDVIDLACTMIQSERQPKLQLFFGRGTIAASLANQGKGHLGSILETPGYLDFPNRVEIRFKPENLIGALEGCPGDQIELGIDPDSVGAPLYINGGSIEYWLAPLQKVDTDD
jgi:DNA polymerase III sliding clamp (beta) subunit (PCNA family)